MARVSNYERYIESLIGEKIVQETTIRVQQQTKTQTKLMIVDTLMNEKFGQAGAIFAAELKDPLDEALLDRVIKAIVSVKSLDELKAKVTVKA